MTPQTQGPNRGDALVDLRSSPSDLIVQARQIYEEAFPAALRAPFSDLLDVRADERSALLLDPETTEVLGLTLVRDLSETWTFLRYFVVSAGRRGQGIGGRLWRALCADLVDRGCTRLLFDVEDPRDPAADAHEREERQRRIRFYQRLGADLVATEAYHPPHHGEPGTQPIPLRLLGADLLDAGEARPMQLDALSADALVRSVLGGRYGLTAP